MAYIVIRELDNAVIGVNKNSLNPQQPSSDFYEVEKTPPPNFMPHWSVNLWTYVSLTDSFVNTGLPMVWY